MMPIDPGAIMRPGEEVCRGSTCHMAFTPDPRDARYCPAWQAKRRPRSREELTAEFTERLDRCCWHRELTLEDPAKPATEKLGRRIRRRRFQPMASEMVGTRSWPYSPAFYRSKWAGSLLEKIPPPLGGGPTMTFPEVPSPDRSAL